MPKILVMDHPVPCHPSKVKYTCTSPPQKGRPYLVISTENVNALNPFHNSLLFIVLVDLFSPCPGRKAHWTRHCLLMARSILLVPRMRAYSVQPRQAAKLFCFFHDLSSRALWPRHGLEESVGKQHVEQIISGMRRNPKWSRMPYWLLCRDLFAHLWWQLVDKESFFMAIILCSLFLSPNSNC